MVNSHTICEAHPFVTKRISVILLLTILNVLGCSHSYLPCNEYIQSETDLSMCNLKCSHGPRGRDSYGKDHFLSSLTMFNFVHGIIIKR